MNSKTNLSGGTRNCAIALIRYRRSLEEVVVHQDAHRAYLRSLKEKGVLIASGPCNPRFGGILLLRVADDDFKALDAVRDNDPFIKAGSFSTKLLGWAPVIGKEDLDKTRFAIGDWAIASLISRSPVTQSPMIADDQMLKDRLAPDQVLLNDPLEHRRIAAAVPRAFRIDDRRWGRLRRCGGSSLWCGGCRPIRRARAPSGGASGTPRPPASGRDRSISGWSDRSREKCAGGPRERRWSRRSPVAAEARRLGMS